MFAYCLNNPTNCVDDYGTRCVSIVSRLNDIGIKKAHDKQEETEENIMDKWRDKGVEYTSNGPNKGGRIENSYLITDYADMYEYAYFLANESEYQDDFTGSVEGIIYEWDIHNIIYYHGPDIWKDNAKDVDLGRTIFSDKHKGLNMVMWLGFYYTYPEQYYSDLFK